MKGLGKNITQKQEEGRKFFRSRYTNTGDRQVYQQTLHNPRYTYGARAKMQKSLDVAATRLIEEIKGV